MNLAEFLLARFAEDERDAQMLDSDAKMCGYGQMVRRALTGCEAKRRVVELHRDDGYGKLTHSPCVGTSTPGAACMTLRLLALPYADHADYRDEWRP